MANSSDKATCQENLPLIHTLVEIRLNFLALNNLVSKKLNARTCDQAIQAFGTVLSGNLGLLCLGLFCLGYF